MSTRDYVEKDYYKVLGVAKEATPAEIKKAYRALARKLHPDANPGDAKAEARFKDVSEANDVLSDPAKRAEYDEVRAAYAGGGRGFGGQGTPFDVGDLFNRGGQGRAGGLGDLFGGLFGGGAAPGGQRQSVNRARRGTDLEASATLAFADAVQGVTVPLRLSTPSRCRTCTGSGARPGTLPHSCSVCDGTGTVTRNAGGFGFAEPCRACRGSGSVVDDPCPTCLGSGQSTESRTLQVRIPAGVEDGQRIRLAGKGGPGAYGGPAGDLLVTVRVTRHPVFGRKGRNLTLTLPLSFAEAALGATVRVPTLLDDPVTLRIPAGSASGRTLRVRGKGVPEKSGERGDLLVTLEVSVPAKLNAAAEKALKAYADAVTDDPRAGLTALVREQAGEEAS